MSCTQCLAFLHAIFELGEVVGKTIEEEIEWEYSNMRYVFSGFLTVVVLSLEFMNATHGGFKKAISHLFRSSNGGKREISWPVVIVCLLKVGLILFCATLFSHSILHAISLSSHSTTHNKYSLLQWLLCRFHFVNYSRVESHLHKQDRVDRRGNRACC